MNTRDDTATTPTNAVALDVPVLVPIGDAANAVLGFPWGGDEYFGFTPPRFEFEEDTDDKEDEAARG